MIILQNISWELYNYPMGGMPIKNKHCLVVWNINVVFPYVRNFIIPTDEIIFFRGVTQPPSSIAWCGCCNDNLWCTWLWLSSSLVKFGVVWDQALLGSQVKHLLVPQVFDDYAARHRRCPGRTLMGNFPQMPKRGGPAWHQATAQEMVVGLGPTMVI